MARSLALLQHLMIAACGVVAAVGYANLTVTTHPHLGLAASIVFAAGGVLGVYAILRGNDRLEVPALIMEGGVVLIWAAYLAWFISHGENGSWQGVLSLSAWGVGLLRSAVKVSRMLDIMARYQVPRL